jgi:hypothetical protein
MCAEADELTDSASSPERQAGEQAPPPSELFIYRSLQASSEWSRFADPKLLGVIVLLGLGLNGLLGNAGALADAHRTGTVWGWMATLFLWIGLGLAAVTVLAVSMGLFPRLKSRGIEQSLFFFGGIAKYDTASQYEDAVRKLTEAGLQQELARQAWEVAVVAAVKHRWARRAYWCALLFLAAWAISMIGLKLT